MSVDVTYESLAPMDSEGAPVQWYSSFGLADGRLALSNEELGTDGAFRTGLHKPTFFPSPVYAFVGPEGGGVGIASWFLVAITSAMIFTGARFYRRRSQKVEQMGAATVAI